MPCWVADKALGKEHCLARSTLSFVPQYYYINRKPVACVNRMCMVNRMCNCMSMNDVIVIGHGEVMWQIMIAMCICITGFEVQILFCACRSFDSCHLGCHQYRLAQVCSHLAVLSHGCQQNAYAFKLLNHSICRGVELLLPSWLPPRDGSSLPGANAGTS